MPSVSVQFHSLPEEMVPFVRQIVKEFGLHVTVMRFFPFRVSHVNEEGLDRLIVNPDAFLEFAFSLTPSTLSVSSQLDFGDKNPSCMYLQIEHPTDEGLAQSCLSSRTDDNEALSVWRKVASRLRRMTTAGVTVTNLDTGATGVEKSFRYTEGAKKAEKEGMRMLSVPGVPNLRLGMD